MEKARKITNGISWGIVAVTGILLLVSWRNIPESVITHIGGGISYGSKNTLLILFGIEFVVSLLFTLNYDIPFIREMRKSRVSSKLLTATSIIVQITVLITLSLFILLAVAS